jgi:hypothetical protein
MNCPECSEKLTEADTDFGSISICNICKIIILKVKRTGANNIGITMGKNGVLIGVKKGDRSEIDPINEDLKKWR